MKSILVGTIISSLVMDCEFVYEGPHMSEQEQLVMWTIRTLRIHRGEIRAAAVQSLLADHAIEYTHTAVQAALDSFTQCGYQIATLPNPHQVGRLRKSFSGGFVLLLVNKTLLYSFRYSLKIQECYI